MGRSPRVRPRWLWPGPRGNVTADRVVEKYDRDATGAAGASEGRRWGEDEGRLFFFLSRYSRRGGV